MPLPDFESAEELETEGQGEEGQVSEETLDDKLSKVQQTVQNTVQQGLQQNQQLVSLLADQDIQEVLRRKQRGEQVFGQPAGEPEAEPNFEEMDQKQLVQYLAKNNQKLVAQTVQETMAPLLQQLKSVQGVVQQTQEDKAVQMVQAAAQKYMDFDQYRPQMVKLAERNPDATPDELYVMAAMRAGKQPQLKAAQQTRSRQASSERPSHTTARPGSAPPKGASPREAFNYSMAKALKNIDLTGLEPTIDD